MMDELAKLQLRLDKINEELSSYEIDSKTHNYMSLINERINLASKISKLKWNSLSEDERLSFRIEDFVLTEKYFIKFGKEIEDRYLFKKKYISLVKKVKSMMLPKKPVLTILYSILNSSIYMDSTMKPYLDIVMKELYPVTTNDMKELKNLYDEVTNMKYPN